MLSTVPEWIIRMDFHQRTVIAAAKTDIVGTEQASHVSLIVLLSHTPLVRFSMRIPVPKDVNATPTMSMSPRLEAASSTVAEFQMH